MPKLTPAALCMAWRFPFTMPMRAHASACCRVPRAQASRGLSGRSRDVWADAAASNRRDPRTAGDMCDNTRVPPTKIGGYPDANPDTARNRRGQSARPCLQPCKPSVHWRRCIGEAMWPCFTAYLHGATPCCLPSLIRGHVLLSKRYARSSSPTCQDIRDSSTIDWNLHVIAGQNTITRAAYRGKQSYSVSCKRALFKRVMRPHPLEALC